VALSNTSIADERVADGVRHVTFAETEPLSTYLFSFVAGRFTRDVRSRGGRTISAYHRETDSAKIAQLDTIFAQVFDALDWQEEFTGVKYPFAKYDFVIVPGFQFGGMEHTGATLYNDRMMFLGSHPTPAEELSRAQLIAHETSHMWFGDLVTMAWFDDVWTKEVFANYFAAVITEPHFADINHTLNRISSFYIPSLREERTEGSTAIQQPLDNLQDAGLLYNNIIYDKAPLVMFKIVDIMGKEAYQRGIRSYVQRYAYDNATWDNLVACLDAETDADLRTFSDVWIKAKGMPTITLTPAGHGFDVVQSDRYGRGLTWRQKFTVAAVGADTVQIVAIDLDGERVHCDTDFEVLAVVPNSDGTGYGYFAPDDGTLSYMCKNLGAFADDVLRMSAALTIYENYLNGRFADADVPVEALLAAARTEGNALIASAIIEALDYACTHSTGERRRSIELAMDSLAETMPSEAGRLQMQRKVVSVMTQPEIVERYQQRWAQMSAPLWSESDYTTAAYELAVRMPQNADSILATQRRRISNADRLKQFDYVSRACTADTVQLDALFESLRDVQNRLIEPYAQSLLYYLNHPVRDAWSARYIAPGLDMLSEIQRTGDIFFPGKWTQMLLSSHRSAEAHAALREWLASHPDCPPLLRNKILLAAERDALRSASRK
jgi:aminopeptidase N